VSVLADLTGRRVLITGASSGIGAATARALVACGASVAMLARRKDRRELFFISLMQPGGL